MISVLFKNVGQGDSILIEWIKDSKKHYGIIDGNLYKKQNPLLDEIISRKIKSIDFIILSHPHYDHYSGLTQILEYCLREKIHIKYFLHTLGSEALHIFSEIILSQESLRNTKELLFLIDENINNKIIENHDQVTHSLNRIQLTDTVYLSFYAPNSNDYLTLTKQRANYNAGISPTTPNFNMVSTIIVISDGIKSIILTSDAMRHSFERIIDKIKSDAILIQVPHHGSLKNLHELFWSNISKSNSCPAVFSVGEDKHDKLPDKEVVEFFDKEGYNNQSTNYIYGLCEYYNKTSVKTISEKSLLLSTFSIGSNGTSMSTLKITDRFNGDKLFSNLI